MIIGIDARFWNETGVGRYIRNLVEQLSEIDKTNFYVLFMKNQDRGAFKPKNERWKVVGTDIHWHSFSEQINFPKILYEQNLDLMHFPYFSIPVIYSKPYVVTVHDLILHHFATGESSTLPFHLYYLKLAGYKYIMKKAARNSKKIITVSKATKNEIVDHLGILDQKIDVIFEGVDPQLGKTIRHTPYAIRKKYFLHVGNVYPHKNAKRLIQAFAQAGLDNYSLFFVGKKDYFMTSLEKYVKQHGLEKKIKFLGFVTDEDLRALYRDASATVVPSLMEGFGLPVLEAMANNSLVLASAIPSIKEIAEDCVLYCDPYDIGDISAKIRNIAEGDNEHFISLRKKGLTQSKKYSWKEMAQQTLTLYESCTSI